MSTFHYTVDDEAQTTDEHTLTPRQILQHAGIDDASHYLIEIQGQHQVSYKDKPDEQIHMHQNMKFISVYNGPTTVS